jgi:BirA family biotin operon repressor/biotin-[acetyl-CoA-carboxylase] ligase
MSWTISPVPRNHASRLAVWTGLMVVEAVREITGEDVRLKWPNDLWLHGRKLGGMILDLVQRGPERLLVAGLGINIGKWPDTVPDEVLVRATKLDEGVRLSVLIAAILNRHDRERPRFLEEGWPAFRKRLDELDVLRGRTIELRDARGVHQATALGIDDDGALLVDINGQQETVLAGDVHITKA